MCNAFLLYITERNHIVLRASQTSFALCVMGDA